MRILELLILLALANGAPVAAAFVLRERFSWPLDGGVRFIDGQPLFGKSKTVRGVVFSVLVAALVGELLDLGWRLGAALGATSMAGDLISSFIKRRLKLPPSSRATGLDHIPESLLPLLVCQQALGLTAAEITAIVVLFLFGNMVVSPIFYKLRIRKHPW
jgi:CDP-2,3-bis-(O-geranylgeranyl)-sn-glycerol synthase